MKYVLGFDIGGTKSAVLLARPGKETWNFWKEKPSPLTEHGRKCWAAWRIWEKPFWKHIRYPGKNAVSAFPAEDLWTAAEV